MLPALGFWVSGSALFTIGSFAFFAVLGFVGIANMKENYRNLMIFGYIIALSLFILGWWQTARQEEASATVTATLTTIQSALKQIADSANVNSDQSAQTLAEDIIKRLAPLKEGLETTKKEVDSLANPPRNPNALYQYREIVAEVQGAVIDQANGIVKFQFVRTGGKANPAREIEYQDWVLLYSGLEPPDPNSFIGNISGVITGLECRIVRKRLL